MVHPALDTQHSPDEHVRRLALVDANPLLRPVPVHIEDWDEEEYL